MAPLSSASPPCAQVPPLPCSPEEETGTAGWGAWAQGTIPGAPDYPGRGFPCSVLGLRAEGREAAKGVGGDEGWRVQVDRNWIWEETGTRK